MSFRPAQRAVVVLAMSVAVGGCGKTLTRTVEGPSAATLAAVGAGAVSTKNTTRVGGSSAAVDAAAIARLVYPSAQGAPKPRSVVLVGEHDWPGALAASVLTGAPLHAPLLYTEGFVLPSASDRVLGMLAPSGSSALGGVQEIRVGDAAAPPEWRVRSVGGGEPAQTAVAVEQLETALVKHRPRQVIVTAWDAPPEMTAPAAGLAAQSGAPVLFVRMSSIPRPTRLELGRLGRPSIYVLGPQSVVSGAVERALGRYGTVTRVGAGPDPQSNAIAVARFSDGTFGWGVHESGHGFAFINPARPFDAPAAAALSASGDYAPLLLLDESGGLGSALSRYISDVQPGFPPGGPVRGVYNHGWLIGDEAAIPAATQAQLDAMLEISPQKGGTEPELESSSSATGGEAAPPAASSAPPSTPNANTTTTTPNLGAKTSTPTTPTTRTTPKR